MIEALKKLSRESLIYGFGGALGTFLGVFLTPVLTRVFTPGDYGVIELITTATAVLTILLLMGFDTALSIFYLQTEDRERRKEVLSTVLIFMMGLSLVVSLGFLLAARPLSVLIMNSSAYARLWQVNFLAFWFGLFLTMLVEVLRLNFRPWLYTIVNVTKVILTIGTVLYFVVFLRGRLEGYFYAALATNGLLALIGLGLIWRYLAARFSWTTLKAMLRIGWPLIPANLSAFTLNLIDRFFLARYSDLSEVGLYSLGVRLASVIVLFVGAFQLAWNPFALSMAKDEQAKPLYARVLTYYLLVGGLLATGITTFGQELLHIFATPAYFRAVDVVGLLTLSWVAYGAYYIVAIGATITKRTGAIAWTTGLAAVSNIVLNFILIPPFGMIGAAVATVLSYLLSVLLLYRASDRYYPVPYSGKKALTIGLLTVAAMVVGMWLNRWPLAVGLPLKIGLIAAYALVLWFSPALEGAERAFAWVTLRSWLRRGRP